MIFDVVEACWRITVFVITAEFLEILSTWIEVPCLQSKIGSLMTMCSWKRVLKTMERNTCWSENACLDLDSRMILLLDLKTPAQSSFCTQTFASFLAVFETRFPVVSSFCTTIPYLMLCEDWRFPVVKLNKACLCTLKLLRQPTRRQHEKMIQRHK